MPRRRTGTKRGNGEGSIYLRKDGRWVGQFFVPQPGGGIKRKYLYAKTEKAVRDRLRDQQYRTSRNLPIDNEKIRLGTWLDHWLTEIVSGRPKTLQSYSAMVRRHFTPALGGIRLAKLSAIDVDRYKNLKLNEGLAPKTVRNQLTALRQALKEALRRDLIARNVAMLVSLPSVPRFNVTPLSEGRAREVLQATSHDRLAPLHALALGMGMRQSELLGLRWRDLDIDSRTLSISRTLQRIEGRFVVDDTKTARSRRTLYLPERLVNILLDWRVSQLKERVESGTSWSSDWDDLMFTTASGEPLAGYNVTRRFQTLLRQAGLPRMRFHDLRHGAATILLALGVDMRTIMETLGHSQIHVTMNTYASVVPQLKSEASARIGEALWG